MSTDLTFVDHIAIESKDIAQSQDGIRINLTAK